MAFLDNRTFDNRFAEVAFITLVSAVLMVAICSIGGMLWWFIMFLAAG